MESQGHGQVAAFDAAFEAKHPRNPEDGRFRSKDELAIAKLRRKFGADIVDDEGYSTKPLPVVSEYLGAAVEVPDGGYVVAKGLIPDKKLNRMSKKPVAKEENVRLLKKAWGGGKRRLAHAGLGEVQVPFKFISHSSSTCSDPLVLQLLSDYSLCKTLFSSGTARAERILLVKEGKIDYRKLEWDECWHVTTRTAINGRERLVDFTIYKRKGAHHAYDLDLVKIK